MANHPKNTANSKRTSGGRRQRARRRRNMRPLVTLLVLAAGIAAFCWALSYLRGSGRNPAAGADGPDGTDVSAETTATAERKPTGTTDAIGTTSLPATTSVTTAATTVATTAKPVQPIGHYVQRQAPSWNLLLVNPWNPLPAGYDYDANLAAYAAAKEFDSRAMEALKQMIADGAAYNLSAASLYRTYELQTKLYNNEVARWKNRGYAQAAAEEKAATVVARPGTSEHHTGMAVDILGSGYSSLEESFDRTPAFRWLKEHCAEYGFILRYPKEKEDVTGVIYEPWHYRYVGVEYAREIMSRGLTLEEFLAEKGW